MVHFSLPLSFWNKIFNGVTPAITPFNYFQCFPFSFFLGVFSFMLKDCCTFIKFKLDFFIHFKPFQIKFGAGALPDWCYLRYPNRPVAVKSGPAPSHCYFGVFSFRLLPFVHTALFIHKVLHSPLRL